MFRCQLTGELSDRGEKPIFVVTEKRRKEYFGYRPKKNKRFNSDRKQEDNYRSFNEPEKIGEGWEIVSEIRVRKSSLEKHGPLEVREIF